MLPEAWRLFSRPDRCRRHGTASCRRTGPGRSVDGPVAQTWNESPYQQRGTGAVIPLILAAICVPLSAGTAAAQSEADFLFGRPRGSVAVRGSWLFAAAGSDLFDFVTDQLTIEKGDFDGPVVGAEVGLAIAPRADLVVGFDVNRASTTSEYRNFVDQDDVPIGQDTSLTQLHLHGSIKVWVLPRGREISRFAWVPRSIVPYVGGGAGLLWYEFKQTGDFVDFVDLSIFNAALRSSGWTPVVHLSTGVDLKVTRRLFLELEGRYLWAEAELGRDFVGFDPIDLSGLRVTAGVNVLF